jgi:hypothetical protein
MSGREGVVEGVLAITMRPQDSASPPTSSRRLASTFALLHFIARSLKLSQMTSLLTDKSEFLLDCQPIVCD